MRNGRRISVRGAVRVLYGPGPGSWVLVLVEKSYGYIESNALVVFCIVLLIVLAIF